MEASPHPRQAERLRALQSYEVLDTQREHDFDEIVALAAKLCGSAISVVNLIDADRQWFKAETGLGVRETPLATSLCAHAILESDFLEIPDTLEDSRMADNPLCTGDPGLRFYAGALLKTDEGLPLGTLCVLDYAPGRLTALQRETLQVLARQVMVQLEMRRALRQAEILRREVDHRVKNSLQSVASFARLKAQSLDDETVRRAVLEVGQRVNAAAMLHDLLYKTDAGPSIDLGRYLHNIGRYLDEVAPEGVTLTVEAAGDGIAVASDQAASVGVLLNEFAANAFKHAFPDGRGGTVRVTMHSLPDGAIRIACRDDGVGMPPETERRQGLGLMVAEAACQQLGCSLTLSPGAPGLVAEFSFAPRAS